jgi:putative flippase GtrA
VVLKILSPIIVLVASWVTVSEYQRIRAKVCGFIYLLYNLAFLIRLFTFRQIQSHEAFHPLVQFASHDRESVTMLWVYRTGSHPRRADFAGA